MSIAPALPETPSARPIRHGESGLAWGLWIGALALGMLAMMIRIAHWDILFPEQDSPKQIQEILIWNMLIPSAVPAYATVGALIIARMPRYATGWACLFTAVVLGLQNFAWQYMIVMQSRAGAPPELPVSAWVNLAAGVSLFPFLCTILQALFIADPNRTPYASQLMASVWLIGGIYLLLGLLALDPFAQAAMIIARLLALPDPLLWHTALRTAFNWLRVVLLIAVTILLVSRWSITPVPQRQRISTMLYAGAFLTFAILIMWASNNFLNITSLANTIVAMLTTTTVAIVLPIAIGVAVLRRQRYGIDLLMDRIFVYGTLVMGTIAIYILLIGIGKILTGNNNSYLFPLIATMIAAILFQPMRDRIQHAMHRWLYGERDDPYAVLTSLGQRLEGALAPESVLPTIVATVRDALHLPYVAIFLEQDNIITAAAADGAPSRMPLFLPLVYQGETIGHMILEAQSDEQGFSPADQRLLADFARQIGVVAHTVRLTAELQHARERLVSAREEERRRLRRDLHDGLGPQLASLALMLTAARRMIEPNPQAAETLLNDATHHMQTAIVDVRRLVYDLRPPALDLGLIAAIRDQIAQYQPSGIIITIEAPAQLPPLTAAVEVAAYRIVQEALTNMVKHSGATACKVILELGNVLTIRVRDNGRGIAEGAQAGVGSHSMRERAQELGGSCTIERIAIGGTQVCAIIPYNTQNQLDDK